MHQSGSCQAIAVVEPSIGELFLDVAADLRQMFTAGCADIGLTFMETRALRHAARHRDQAVIVEALGLAPTRVSALLGSLQRKGLLTRSAARGDHRHRVVELTDQGRDAIERIDIYLDEHSSLMRSLDDDQRDALRRILVAMRTPRP